MNQNGLLSIGLTQCLLAYQKVKACKRKPGLIPTVKQTEGGPGQQQ